MWMRGAGKGESSTCEPISAIGCSGPAARPFNAVELATPGRGEKLESWDHNGITDSTMFL